MADRTSKVISGRALAFSAYTLVTTARTHARTLQHWVTGDAEIQLAGVVDVSFLLASPAFAWLLD